jgi:GDP-mannose 6-dehydrogenase
MNVSIFGLGYVGCVSMGCLAHNGHRVIGVDISDNKINLINNGKPTIIEKQIDELISENFKNGRISATKDYKEAVKNSDISIICVGTPSGPNGHLHLDFLFSAVKQIAEAIKEKDSFHVIAIRSTVIPGTNKKAGKLIEEISGKIRDTHFTVISNPEFMREGSAVADYNNPAFTVIGSDSPKGIEIISDIYKEINAPIEVTSIDVAEIIKYVNNTYHALKVVFANEIGNICKNLEIDSHKVMELFCKDDRLNISKTYFMPGFAYGGSCLPKDLKGLNTLAHDTYLTTPVIASIEESNNIQKSRVFEIIQKVDKKKIGVLGFSFKAGTDDLRYSPIVEVTETLIGKGFQVKVFDENVNLTKLTGTNKDYIDKHIPHLSDLISDDLIKTVEFAEVVVISQKDKRFNSLIDKYPDKIFIDLVRIFDAKTSNNYIGICW